MEDPGEFESSSSNRSVSPLNRGFESTGLQRKSSEPTPFGGVTAGASAEEKLLEAAKTAEGEGLLSKLTPSCVVSSGWEEHSSFSAATAEANSSWTGVPHWISALQLPVCILTQEWYSGDTTVVAGVPLAMDASPSSADTRFADVAPTE